jgi:hypothetical protein
MLGSAPYWLDANRVDLAVAAVLVIAFQPLVLLTHELGHAAVGLVHTEGLVRVRVGRSPGIWRARLGRLSLELHPVPARGDTAGAAVTYARFGWRSRLLYALAGPLAGSGAALVLILLGLHSGLRPLAFAGSFALFIELCNLLPSRTSPRTGDGNSILETLQTRRRPLPYNEFADVESRFLVLVTDARGTLAGRGGGRLLKVLNALDLDPSDRSREAQALVRTAFSGWCWREAEQADTAPIRDAVLDARHRASLRGLTRADTAGLAADELVRNGPDLATASPTLGSLDYGLRRALASKFTSGVPLEHARFAFQFGVAMHDVATVAD